MEKGDCFGIGKYSLHPIWLDFIAYCRKLGYGELRNLKIKDGLPMVADEVIHKVNFSKYEGNKH